MGLGRGVRTDHVVVGMALAAPVNSAGTEIKPSVAVAGRLATDPLGSHQRPDRRAPGRRLFPSNQAPTTGGRYSATMVDPSDNMTMWTIQEYPSTQYWAVRVVELLAPPPATPLLSSAAVVTKGAVSTDIVVTAPA